MSFLIPKTCINPLIIDKYTPYSINDIDVPTELEFNLDTDSNIYNNIGYKAYINNDIEKALKYFEYGCNMNNTYSYYNMMLHYFNDEKKFMEYVKYKDTFLPCKVLYNVFLYYKHKNINNLMYFYNTIKYDANLSKYENYVYGNLHKTLTNILGCIYKEEAYNIKNNDKIKGELYKKSYHYFKESGEDINIKQFKLEGHESSKQNAKDISKYLQIKNIEH